MHGASVSNDVNNADYQPQAQTAEAFFEQWGVDSDANYQSIGALQPANPPTPARQVYLLQRSKGKLGKSLNKTTGWVHKAAIKQAGVIQMAGVTYDKVTDEGLWVTVDGTSQLLRVDTVVLCVGQESVNHLMPQLGDTPKADYQVIGGAKLSDRLDAKRAIREGFEVAVHL